MTTPAKGVVTPAEYPATLPGLLARNAARYGDRIGLREKDLGIWQEVSWKEYYAHVGRFCLGLKQLGLKRGDHLAILGDNCPEWIYADLAAQVTGAIAVGVYPTNPANQVVVGRHVFEREHADNPLTEPDPVTRTADSLHGQRSRRNGTPSGTSSSISLAYR